jgi:hypothetical protein
VVNVYNGGAGHGTTQRVEVIPLCPRRISRKINNLHIFKNTSLGINCMDKVLLMFKENKTICPLYRIVTRLRQQLFWEVASAIRNVITISSKKQTTCNKVALLSSF